MNKSNIAKIIGSVLTILVSAFLGFLGQKYLQENEDETRYLDFKYEFRSNFIGKPDGFNKKLEVFLDGQKVTDFTQLDIKIYNPTDKAFSDVPLFIEIYSSKGDTLKLLESNITGKEDYSDFIDTISNLSPVKNKGALKYTYNIKTIHKLGEKPVFQASYVILGRADQFHIDLIKEGLDLGEYDITHYTKPKIWERDIFLWGVIIIGYLGLIIILRRYQGWRIKSHSKKFETYLIENFKMGVPGENVLFDKETLIKQFIRLRTKFNWLETSKIMRIIDGDKNPDEDLK